jgi:hypothetical protein
MKLTTRLHLVPWLTWLQRILFCAKAPTSFQVFPIFPISSSTVLLHVLLDPPLLRRPWGFQLRTCLSIACGSFLKVFPIHCHLLSFVCWIAGFSFAICQRCSFEINSGQKILKFLLKHLEHSLYGLPSLTSIQENWLNIGRTNSHFCYDRYLFSFRYSGQLYEQAHIRNKRDERAWRKGTKKGTAISLKTSINTRRWPNWAETCCVILKFKCDFKV